MSSTAATTSTSAAGGIWRSNEVMQTIQAFAWPLNSIPIEYLISAGGGGGGAGYGGGGGGGAGGLLTTTNFPLPKAAVITITVGAGGLFCISSSQ